MLPTCLWITTGTLNGIGLEITIKAIQHLQAANELNSDHALIVVTNDADRWAWSKLAEIRPQFLWSYQPPPAAGIYVLNAPPHPAQWVESVAKICLKEPQRNILITGPLDKQQFLKDGYQVMGHTGLLAQVTHLKKDDLFMYFLGATFDVVLLTDHIPLTQVSDKLSAHHLEKRLNQLHGYLTQLPFVIKNRIKQIRFLGLNPHAGDDGLISPWDAQTLLPLIESLAPWPWPWQGPLPPDSAFIDKDLFHLHPLFIAHYHDQGLIPFKLQHGFAGTHITLGLPFWRVSVDHGPATKLYGLDRADPQSMIEAIRIAIHLFTAS